jgi:putative acetyltransferase
MNVSLAESPDALDRFQELNTEYEASLPPELRHAEFEEERARLYEIYAPPNAAFVAELDGIPCGCVAFVQRDASTGVIRHLYVRPAFRKHGVGRALLEALIELARKRGYSRVVLDTHREELQAAYRLYRAFGFTECEPSGKVGYSCPTFMDLEL